MTLALIAAAAVLLAWPYLAAHWHEIRLPKLEPHHYAVALLLAAAAWRYYSTQPQPGPAPAPPAALTLAGKFTGEHAARDAAIVAALCHELADEVEWDGRQPQPLITTGAAFDELRVRSRRLMCRGQSVGDRQPAARDAIAAWLNQVAGTSAGPLTADTRAAWVSAYREVGRAAEAAR